MLVLFLIMFIIIIDQSLKTLIISKIIDISYSLNTGMAFSIFSENNIVFLIILPIFLIFIYYLYNKGSKNILKKISTALIIGGGISNYIDRLRIGAVVDYIYAKGYFIFNIADITIVLGIILLSIYYIFYDKGS